MATSQSSFSGVGAGESCKKLKSASPWEKLCVIISLTGDYGVFIVDLNDADAKEELVEKLPNLRLRGFGGACFCVLEYGKLYIFPGSPPYAQPKQKAKPNDGVARLRAYSLELSREVLESPDLVLEKKSMKENKSHKMLGPKQHPEAVPVLGGRRILVFSREVIFKGKEWKYDASDEFYCDFEIYDPLMNKCTKLPQLYVHPHHEHEGTVTYELFHPDPDTPTWEEFHGCWPHFLGVRSPYFYFYINAYTTANDGSLFIVQTNFGRQFILDLDLDLPPEEKREWKLFDSRIQLSCFSNNLITTPDWVVLDSLGATEYCRDRRVDFPLSSFDNFPSFVAYPRGLYGSRSICLLKPRSHHPIDTACVVRTGQDGRDEYPNKLYWFLDLLTIDYYGYELWGKSADDQQIRGEGESNDEILLGEGEGEEKNVLTSSDEYGWKFVKRISSFKFYLNDHVGVSYIAGLFPFES